MKILFYCPFKFNLLSKNINSLGGIETLNIELSRELAKKSYKVFLATQTTKIVRKFGILNIPIKNIREKAKTSNFDIIISSNDPLIFNYFSSSKNIFWMHNTLSIEKAIRKKKFFSLIRNKINVVFVSKYLKEKTSKLYFFDNSYIIPNFLSKIFEDTKKNYNRKPIFVWSVQRTKGLKEFLDIWINKINPLYKNAKFYVFGANDKDIIRNKNRYLKNNIFFFKKTSKYKLKKIYNKSLSMICLGYDETFCLNALEANACGLPVISFGKTALKDLISHNKNGIIVKNFDEIAKTIIRIIELNDKKKKRLISTCYNHSKKYTINKIINSWQNLLR